MEKKCSRCNIMLDLDLFRPHPNGKYGKFSICKECVNKRRRQWRNTKQGRAARAKERKGYNRKRKLWLLSQLGVSACEICQQENHPAALDFHHIDPSKKSFNIATSLAKTKPTLLKEARKCKVICSNCHRKLHWTND